ncbi:hypothetical protein Fmac_018358 [Flemingia macrophylla]|uniref:Uncharacterized protein n=1 Tax=Flemingia macrophylla TaxID=520843 RepID=A0ABD1M4S6_9FABA
MELWNCFGNTFLNKCGGVSLIHLTITQNIIFHKIPCIYCNLLALTWQSRSPINRDHAAWWLLPRGVLRGHKLVVLYLAATGNLVFNGSANKNVCMWKRDKSGFHTCYLVLTGHTGPMKCIVVEEEQPPRQKGDQGRHCCRHPHGEGEVREDKGEERSERGESPIESATCFCHLSLDAYPRQALTSTLGANVREAHIMTLALSVFAGCDARRGLAVGWPECHCALA